jgi:hypothetical protein
MSALLPLIGALLAVCACYSLGSLLLAWLGIALPSREKLPLAFTLGAAVLHLAMFAVLALHIAYVSVLVTILAAIIAAALLTGTWRAPADSGPSPRSSPQSWLTRTIRFLLLAAAALYTILYFFNAWAPEISPDGASYHLPMIARYLRVHGFEAVPTDIYSTLSEGIELIFLPAFAIGGGSAAALVHLSFLVALALMIRAYGRRVGHALAGEAAAVLVYLSPVAGIDGTSAYVDAGVAALVFSVFYWTELWDADRRNALLVCVGMLGGYCYAAKYTAATIAVYAVGFVLWRTRKWKAAALVIACAALMAVPWMLKDWIYVHNPIAPFGNRFFRNPYIHVEFERYWTDFLRTYGVSDRRKLLRDVFLDGQVTGTPLGAIFLLLPLGLLALRKKTGRHILIAGAIVLSTYFANISTRFLLPSLPFFSLALTIALDDAPIAFAAIALFHAWASWPPELRKHTKAEWAIQHIPVRAALRLQSADDYLSKSRDYRVARMIERTVPLGERVLVMGGVATLYAERELLVCYEGAVNEQLCDTLAAAWDEFSAPSRALVFRFPEHALSGIRVLQTIKAPKPDELWSVHELRIFRGTNHQGEQEVPRSADWRLSAFPNPWDAGLAFDNSPVTRWRSWETAAPDMYISVRFQSEVRADQVRIETSSDNADLKLRLEEMDADGKWKPLRAASEEFTRSPEGSLRRAASYELKANGIGYVLVDDRDRDHGAPFFAEDPASWDFTPVAHAEGATLYKVGR